MALHVTLRTPMLDQRVRNGPMLRSLLPVRDLVRKGSLLAASRLRYCGAAVSACAAPVQCTRQAWSTGAAAAEPAAVRRLLPHYRWQGRSSFATQAASAEPTVTTATGQSLRKTAHSSSASAVDSCCRSVAVHR